MPKNVASPQIQKVAIFDSDRLNINLIPKNHFVSIPFKEQRKLSYY